MRTVPSESLRILLRVHAEDKAVGRVNAKTRCRSSFTIICRKQSTFQAEKKTEYDTQRERNYDTQLSHLQHQTVDEVHQEVQERLTALGVSISRREILYLFDAYCSVLRAASEAKEDQHWLAQVKEKGGIIVSVDGIQPDRGNETIYLVRDALTGRMLAAENVISSETEVMKALLAPVVALEVKVLGTITDAQESELRAVEQLWPDVPHQVCQFHILREASRPAFEADRKVKTALRKRVGEKVRVVRKQLKGELLAAEEAEAEQLKVLDDYALGIQTALNRDGTLPFEYPGVQAGEDLDEVAESLWRLKKKG